MIEVSVNTILNQKTFKCHFREIISVAHQSEKDCKAIWTQSRVPEFAVEIIYKYKTFMIFSQEIGHPSKFNERSGSG